MSDLHFWKQFRQLFQFIILDAVSTAEVDDLSEGLMLFGPKGVLAHMRDSAEPRQARVLGD